MLKLNKKYKVCKLNNMLKLNKKYKVCKLNNMLKLNNSSECAIYTVSDYIPLYPFIIMFIIIYENVSINIAGNLLK